MIPKFNKKYKDISVIQLDAHSDLRNDYHGSKNNHACVMKRAKEVANIVQVGIRSTDTYELKNVNEKLSVSGTVTADIAKEVKQNTEEVKDTLMEMVRKYLSIWDQSGTERMNMLDINFQIALNEVI